MTNPTSNFGWQMPTASDLVTDLPADFETFGQAVDTSLADLKGGTSGQILAKASNTDMDFTWVTNDVGDITAVTAGTGISGGGTSGAVTITNSMATEISAKGDLIAGTGSQTFDNLTVGSNDALLIAASGETTGLKWGGLWQSFTPTITNFTQGNGTVVGRYSKIGKTVSVYLNITLGSTSSVGGSEIYMDLPINAAYSQQYAGTIKVVDAGVIYFFGFVQVNTSNCNFYISKTDGTYGNAVTGLTTTVPMTWTTNDQLIAYFSYEVA